MVSALQLVTGDRVRVKPGRVGPVGWNRSSMKRIRNLLTDNRAGLIPTSYAARRRPQIDRTASARRDTRGSSVFATRPSAFGLAASPLEPS